MHQKNYFPSSVRRAFSLVEVLTVVAIIGILAAILIPVVGSFKSRSLTARCASNLRTLGQAVHLYAVEHNGLILPAQRYNGYTADSGLPATFNQHWTRGIIMEGLLGAPDVPNPYYTPLRSASTNWGALCKYYTVLGCPLVQQYRASGDDSSSGTAYADVASGRVLPTQALGFITYGANNLLSGLSNGGADGPPTPKYMGDVVDPSKAVVMGDRTLSFTNQSMAIWILPSSGNIPEGLHDGRANILFLDGHVDSVDPTNPDQLPTRVNGATAMAQRIYWQGSYE